ncbi:sigma-54-dependent Fis family transcriptional regulator [Aggregicoccus sp. 17bor-14]|uniref:sigma 54-interacting transcriptional regulator n=1 Tax=Myxococcaceae TaxID=31 RepID=UPI00129C67C5|nr:MULTISPECIES: sigma-54 dependent transcriptional regulator [Myxococcaceae]MBF5042322.1 sigma-54-dependent Fis family transcriptional regulator [Simulacricoccus sp. 17bor-14]MRI88096.1 sigma-54-dependent Fis family transcriptional regulator [Aggregicoccus sp. 17bor-14]
MDILEWTGAAPGPELRQRLEQAGWRLGQEGARAHVVHTAQARLSGRLPAGRWVWLSARPLPVEALRAAVEQGAVDALWTGAEGWEARLLRRLSECLVEELAPPVPETFTARSAAAKVLLARIAQAARTSMPVLLTGETGTGKEVAARLIHQWSERRARTFVPINCAAIPNELMEGELFGYTKGAFSGAVKSYDGLVVAAEGGTMFLDEIDDTPLALQTKLLRVLEDRVVSRLGESTWHKVDFRILAATNRDLKKLIERGTFGDDLYERLSTVQIELPPLRERPEDLEPLVLQWMERYYAQEEVTEGRPRVRGATPEALDVLRAYPWPGNIRELRNVIYGALVAKRAGDELLVSDLPRRLWRRERAGAGTGVVSVQEVERKVAAGSMNLRAELEMLERVALQAALRRAGGNAAEAARLLGEVGRGAAKDPGGTVRTMMKRLGVSGVG